MKRTDTIAWECAHCGHRHLWKWEPGDATEGTIRMHCDKCGAHTFTRMVQIGRQAWAALWAGR